MMNGLYIADNRRRFMFARTRMREKNRTYIPSGLNCKLRAHTYTHRIVLLRRSSFLSLFSLVYVCMYVHV